MNITNIRASTANTYQDCPWKYFLLYTIGFKSYPNKKAELGTITHHVLELLAKAKKNGYSKLYESFRTNPEYLLEICWERHTKQYPEFEYDKKDYEFCHEQVWSILNSYYNPLNLKILRTEHQFQIEANRIGFEYDHNDYITKEHKAGYIEFRGTIDLITEVDEDTIEIIDYKTGQRLDWVSGNEKTYDKFLMDLQLRMYDIATSKLYPHKFRMLTIIFTRDGGPFTVTFDANDYENSIDMIRHVVNQIRNDTSLKRLKDRKWDQIWKCDYVCQFGLIEHTFVSEDGEFITQKFKRIQPRYRHKYNYPTEIIENNKKYHRITYEEVRTCDRYYSIIKKSGINEGAKILHQISINETGDQPLSRRNDYENSKISKIKLC